MGKMIEKFNSEPTGKKIPRTDRMGKSNIKCETLRNVPGMGAGLWLEKHSKKQDESK